MKELWTKKLPAFLLAALMLAGTAIPAGADETAGGETPTEHTTHTPSANWYTGANDHWQICTEGGEELNRAPHDYEETVIDSAATCTAAGRGHRTCRVCRFVDENVVLPILPHTPGDWVNTDPVNHWQICSVCSQQINTAAHTFGATVISTPATPTAPGAGTQTCTVCGYVKGVSIPATGHTATGAWKSDAAQHWHSCALHPNDANDKLDVANHSLGYRTISTAQHQQYCTVCGYVAATADHVDTNNDGKCDVCGQTGLTTGDKFTVTFISAGSNYQTQSVVKNGKPTAPGTPSRKASDCSYTFVGWSTTNPGTTAAYSGQSGLYTSAQVANIAVTANTTYYAVYIMNASSQNVSTDVSDTSGITVGSTVRNQINSKFSSLTGRTFTTVTFTSVSTTAYGTLYANTSSASLVGRTYDYNGGSYPVTNLYFVPSGSKGTYTVTYTATDGYSTATGTLSINTTASSNTKITYTVRPGQRVSLSRSDFNRVYQSAYNETVSWIQFTSIGSYSASDGIFYYNYNGSSQRSFSRSEMDDYAFYYNSSSYGSYPLEDMSFVADASAAKKTISFSFRAYYSNSRYVDGTMELQISGTSSSSITYQVEPGSEVTFNRSDFNRVFQDSYSGYDLRYVNFTSTGYDTSYGTMYFNYGGKNERSFTKNNFTSYGYYYSSTSYGDYALEDLSFVAASGFTGSFSVTFRAYYDNSRYVDGTMVIQAKETANRGDVRYYTTGNTNVQINPNDIGRFLNKTYSGVTLRYVKLEGVPDTGTLYYNYYGVSSYGTSSLRLTSSNCGSQNFYFSPSGSTQYSLSELTYIPSGTNYCATIPFTAYSTNNRSVRGNILISVNSVTVQDVYGATPVNTSVTFPADSIYNAVRTAVGSSYSMYSIQLLELPTASKGTIYVGTGSTKANTTSRYTYSASSGSGRIGELRFVPASGFTGSVEIPYVAYTSNNRSIASGRLCLGIVKSLKTYSDVNSGTWCYKYVAELSDAKVIDGYLDGYFRPDKTVTYGQSLKLIMLASGYSALSPTGKHPFSGYLTRAISDGLLTGVKESDLDRPISRLAVAQITAKAMKLSLSNLSSQKPFTDTSDVYVQALNAAGIVEGYFSSGTSTFKPASTMTRGQISAIVWRMNRAG